jgi:prephenate dehydratase
MIKKISVQGDVASFHHIAAIDFFGKEFELLPCDTFTETCLAIVDGKSDYAVCAIENSLYGSINEVYDLLLKYKLWIVGEVYLRINQNLIGLPGAKVDDITEVYSHPVALAQCEDFLDKKLGDAKRFEYHDTAASVTAIKKWNLKNKAAIASLEASELNGMQLLAKNIETNKHNYTRFVVLSTNKSITNNSNKTSMIIDLPNKQGGLYRALGAFANREIDLTKIESRPIIGKAWHYIFYVDVAVGGENASLLDAIDDLKKQNCKVNIIGSYKSTLFKK